MKTLKSIEEINEEFDKYFQENFMLCGHTPSPKGSQRVWSTAYHLRQSVKSFYASKIEELLKEQAKAYGGCELCFGKGYFTEKTSITAYADFSGTDKKTELMRYNPCSCDRGKQFRQVIEELVKSIVPEKKKLILEAPELRQYEPRGSAPFFCTLCGMSEMNIMENKTNIRGKNKYFCKCSYWSDPHNAYLDKSGGKWLGWIDKKKAQKILEEYPCEENFFNQAIDQIQENINKVIGGK